MILCVEHPNSMMTSLLIYFAPLSFLVSDLMLDVTLSETGSDDEEVRSFGQLQLRDFSD